ncbi:MAG: hypothetical protein ACOVOW_06880 [Spirosomataceae bacterium]
MKYLTQILSIVSIFICLWLLFHISTDFVDIAATKNRYLIRSKIFKMIEHGDNLSIGERFYEYIQNGRRQRAEIAVYRIKWIAVLIVIQFCLTILIYKKPLK